MRHFAKRISLLVASVVAECLTAGCGGGITSLISSVPGLLSRSLSASGRARPGQAAVLAGQGAGSWCPGTAQQGYRLSQANAFDVCCGSDVWEAKHAEGVAQAEEGGDGGNE